MAIRRNSAANQRRPNRPRSTDRLVQFCFSNMPQLELGFYASAFLEGARTLIRSLRRRGVFSDLSAAPVMFMYRHAIELYLKAIIVVGSRPLGASPEADAKLFKSLGNHKLLPLFSRVEEVFKVVGWDWHWPLNPLVETREQVRDLLRFIGTLDPDSFTFRYPVDKRGRRSIASDVRFNLDSVVSALDALAEALETADFGLAAMRGW